MYKRFLEKNFGNVHLAGFNLLVRACELYAEGNLRIGEIYYTIADENNSSYSRVERNIRHYIETTIQDCADAIFSIKIPKFTNQAVIATIVREVQNNETD